MVNQGSVEVEEDHRACSMGSCYIDSYHKRRNRVDESSHSRPRIIPRHQIQSSSVARVTSKYQIMSRLHTVKSRQFRNKELILVEY